MSNPTQPRLHHLAITVTDLDASVEWYESVFDVHPVLDVPHPGGGEFSPELTGSC